MDEILIMLRCIKKRYIFLIVGIVILLFGSLIIREYKEQQSSLSVTVDQSSSSQSEANLEKQAEAEVIELFKSVKDTIDSKGSGTAKIEYKTIEDIYKKYPDNETISNLYAFCVSNDYLYFKDLIDDDKYQKAAEEEAAKISVNYKGEYADYIISYAKNLLGDSYTAFNEEVTKAQDKYNNMTTADKAEVIKYIYSRYDYYDKKDGKSTGDKYSNTIWSEAESKFGLTGQMIDQIWIDEDATRYYVNQKSTSNTSSTTTSSITEYDATLEYGDGSVLIFISEDAMSRYMTALAEGNKGTISEMLTNGQVGLTDKGTKCNIVKSGLTKYQVKLLDGNYAGNTVWVIMESVKRK